MITTVIQNEAINLISQNKVDEAIILINDFAKKSGKKGTEVLKQLTLISRENKELKSKEIKGVILYENYNVQKSQISDRLISLVGKLKEMEDENEGQPMDEEYRVDVTIEVDRNFNEFRTEDKEKLLSAVDQLLELNGSVIFKRLKPGSVLFTINLPISQAVKLYNKIKEGKLNQYKVVDAYFHPKMRFLDRDNRNKIDYQELGIRLGEINNEEIKDKLIHSMKRHFENYLLNDRIGIRGELITKIKNEIESLNSKMLESYYHINKNRRRFIDDLHDLNLNSNSEKFSAFLESMRNRSREEDNYYEDKYRTLISRIRDKSEKLDEIINELNFAPEEKETRMKREEIYNNIQELERGFAYGFSINE